MDTRPAIAAHWWKQTMLAAGDRDRLRLALQDEIDGQEGNLAAMAEWIAATPPQEIPSLIAGRMSAWEGNLHETFEDEADQAILHLRLLAAYVQGDFEKMLREAPDLGEPQLAEVIRFQAAAELGRMDTMRLALNEIGQPDWSTLLAGAIAADLAGQADYAGDLRKQAAQAMREDVNVDPRAAELLGEPASADAEQAADVGIEPTKKAVWLAALLQAGAPAELAPMARTLNYGWDFPHHLVQRALVKLPARPNAGAGPRADRPSLASSAAGR